MAPPETYQRSRPEWLLLAMNVFLETNRMEAFVAVYLKFFRGWSYVQIGWLSLAMNVAAFVCQTPVGDLLDKTHDKKLLTIAACIISAVTTTSITWTRTFWVVMIFKAFEGVSASVIVPAEMSLLLGIVPVDPPGRVDRAIADNELASRVGSVLLSFSAGVVALLRFPHVAPVFWLFGGAFLVSAVIVACLPRNSIDDGRARNAAAAEDLPEGETTWVPGAMESVEAEKEPEAEEAVAYCELVKDPNIAVMSLVTFLYHLANAGILVLVVQLIATRNERQSLVFAAAAMTIHFGFQSITCFALGKIGGRVGLKTMMLTGMALCCVRCGVLAALAWKAPDKYALLATQTLDGVCAGIFDTLIRIAVKRLTQKTGRFGVTFGFVITCWQLGHGFSVLLSEFLVQYTTYSIAFLVLASICAVNSCLFGLGVAIPADAGTDVAPGDVYMTRSDSGASPKSFRLSRVDSDKLPHNNSQGSPRSGSFRSHSNSIDLEDDDGIASPRP